MFAPSYDEDIGGVIVLHRLCHLLNELGFESYLSPYFESFEVNRLNLRTVVAPLLRSIAKPFVRKFQVHSTFNTPIIRNISRRDLDQYIVVYPEVVSGNPLGASNVVRWFLHRPGFLTKKVCYGSGELYYDFRNFSEGFSLPSSRLSELALTINHFPLEYYNQEGALSQPDRKGTAYCLRKGKHKKIVHDLRESILIDGKSHEEIAEIFKRVAMFISYDCYTAYSQFACLCGADSVIVPDDNLTIDQWHPKIEDRYGTAYGFEEIEFARETRSLLLADILKHTNQSKERVNDFAEESQAYFA